MQTARTKKQTLNYLGSRQETSRRISKSGYKSNFVNFLGQK